MNFDLPGLSGRLSSITPRLVDKFKTGRPAHFLASTNDIDIGFPSQREIAGEFHKISDLLGLSSNSMNKDLKLAFQKADQHEQEGIWRNLHLLDSVFRSVAQEYEAAAKRASRYSLSLQDFFSTFTIEKRAQADFSSRMSEAYVAASASLR